MTELTEDEKWEIAADWSDFRKDYGTGSAQEFRAFIAGWKAGRHGEQAGILS